MNKRYIPDDYSGRHRPLPEIEAEAGRFRSFSGLLDNDWIDVDEFMSSLGFKFKVESQSSMDGSESFADAKEGVIGLTADLSRRLRKNEFKARYVWAHEIGHLALHRGPGLRARKAGAGNKVLKFVSPESSEELQAWQFARALFVPRNTLINLTDEQISEKVGIPAYGIKLRREEIETNRRTAQPHVTLREAEIFLAISRDPLILAAWNNSARIPDEDESQFRLTRGYKICFWDYENNKSQMGWTVVNNEAVAFFDLLSR